MDTIKQFGALNSPAPSDQSAVKNNKQKTFRTSRTWKRKVVKYNRVGHFQKREEQWPEVMRSPNTVSQ